MRKAARINAVVTMGALAFLALFLSCPRFMGAQGLPLDEKARYEKSLEQKMDEVLLRLLGPGQAKVVIQASMDFTRTEKVDVTSGGSAAADKSGMFKWQTAVAGPGQPFNDYLLPGFPALGGGDTENRSYQKQLLFPATFIKKLTVTVILNKTMSEAEAQNVRSVVSEVLGLDVKRGDELSIIRTPFAPIWRTIWYTPEAVSLIFKYGIFSFIGVIAMIVVAIGFLKLAAAMTTMAKAQQSHQIRMDIGKGGEGESGGAPPLPGADTLALALGEKSDDRAKDEPGEGDSMVFNVRPEQVDFLVSLMSGEDPANVALVAGHLPESVKSDFMRRLPPDLSMEVISNMARVRFVEPDVISTIGAELEKRLAGSFGGVSQIIESLSRMKLSAKKEMLENLERRHPEVAREVRAKVFLPDDLMRFSEKDFSTLASSVRIEDWALALWGLPAAFKERLRTQLTEKTCAMLEQTMKYNSPAGETVERAVESVLASAAKLISEGRVANPLSAAMDAAPAVPERALAAALPPRRPVNKEGGV